MEHNHPQPPRDRRPASNAGPPSFARPIIWHTPPPDQPGCLTPGLARRLLDTFTRDGNLVVDLGDDPVLPGVTATAGRRHHALAGHTHPAAAARYAGQADLVLLQWPRPATNPRHLLSCARDLLTTGGHLVIAVQVPPSQRTGHLSALAGAAHTAGLQAIGHIVAVAVGDDIGQATKSAIHPHTDLLVFRA